MNNLLGALPSLGFFSSFLCFVKKGLDCDGYPLCCKFSIREVCFSLSGPWFTVVYVVFVVSVNQVPVYSFLNYSRDHPSCTPPPRRMDDPLMIPL